MTPVQQKALELVEQHGGIRPAARALGIPLATFKDRVRRARRAQAATDPKVHVASAPEGFHYRGVSTLVNADGEMVMQWRKDAKDHEDPEAFLRVFRDALEDAPPPAAKKIRAPKTADEDLLAVYPMGDPHLGMLSWAPETGTDNDLKIAKERLCAAVDHLVDICPPAERALIINLGDFVHADNMMGVTSRSGHRLDTDSRWAKVLRVAISTAVYCVDSALKRHRHVTVICEIGNHDDHTAIMLALALDAHYRNEPRVEVDTSPSPFHWYEFGANLIGTTHGNGPKLAQLPGIMAHDQAEAWGRTKWRFWHVGHFHHTKVQEFPGCTVEVHRTLAPRDAWTHQMGYRSGQSMIADILHRVHGRVLRHEVGIERLTTGV